MAEKVRLDLMVNKNTKAYLQQFAREQGISMSEMVDRLIVEHLIGNASESIRAPHPSDAVFDMMWIQELKEWVNDAIANGKVWEFKDFLRRFKTDEERVEAKRGALLYAPTENPYFGIIVADCFVVMEHNDIISTFGGDERGILKTIDAYLSWYDDDDGAHLNGLCIVPKGVLPWSPFIETLFDWSSPAEWPENVPEPWNEVE